jgi:hypothetical protein
MIRNEAERLENTRSEWLNEDVGMGEDGLKESKTIG